MPPRNADVANEMLDEADDEVLRCMLSDIGGGGIGGGGLLGGKGGGVEIMA